VTRGEYQVSSDKWIEQRKKHEEENYGPYLALCSLRFACLSHSSLMYGWVRAVSCLHYDSAEKR
jgi:hypothetical protein